MYFLHKKYCMNNSNIRRTITLKDDVYSRLTKEGKFNESFSQLVTRILNELQKRRESHE
jgi:predicted CopG family antitoxin